ncbi:hypothetical protein [Acidisphaera sp. S103]|uniref:hypothetical protein n=1 Tax=Acidisphaera sp. S103 TaxID=1747223 RepID=UPI00131DC0F6|nr:hypothetical protein [Acidisphaera sp. S103]
MKFLSHNERSAIQVSRAAASFVILSGLMLPVVAYADDVQDQATIAADANAANNPLTPKITLNLQDYFLPSLNRVDGRSANQGLLRGLVPADPFGVPQLIRFTLPVATNPGFPNGTNTGLGDLTLFDLVVIPVKPVLFGVGPLLVAPTATNKNTGAGKWQAGVAGVAVAPQSWGLVAALVTYQHSFAGDDSRPVAQLMTFQPIVTYNLPKGFYLRSSGTWTLDLGNHTTVIPVGFGVGKVWAFGHGNTLNAFVEPQYSVIHSGVGVPVWQIFAGLNFQFAI